MRTAILALALSAAFATASAAQDTGWAARDFEMWQQLQMANQRAVATENQLNALDARQQTEARLRDLEAQRVRPPLTTYGAGPATATSGLPSNIEAWMAASNARVRAAAENRR